MRERLPYVDGEWHATGMHMWPTTETTLCPSCPRVTSMLPGQPHQPPFFFPASIHNHTLSIAVWHPSQPASSSRGFSVSPLRYLKSTLWCPGRLSDYPLLDYQEFPGLLSLSQHHPMNSSSRVSDPDPEYPATSLFPEPSEISRRREGADALLLAVQDPWQISGGRSLLWNF